MGNLVIDIQMTVILLISLGLSIYNLIYVKRRKNVSKLYKWFYYLVYCIFILNLCMNLQKNFMNIIPIAPIYYEYFAYISGCLMPVCLLMVAFLYNNENINTSKCKWLFIIPVVSMIILWTNDIHHLFFVSYGIQAKDVIYGPYFTVHTFYSYACLIASMVIFVCTSFKKSGFFSLQTGLIILSCLIPIVPNILGTLKLIEMNVYLTPILFTFTSILLAIAIIKLKALNITPVAFKTVIDTMSDGFVVISNDGTIVDMNKTFSDSLAKYLNLNKESNFFKSIEKINIVDIEELKNHIHDASIENTLVSDEYHIVYNNINKYYQVDINPVKAARAKDENIATLLLFKDITQHKFDLKTIKENQEIIATQGQLAVLGELAGGVAHDINTPISAIKTGVEILKMEPTLSQNGIDTIGVIDRCTIKIINIVNSMRNQMRNLGSNEKVEFDIETVVNDIMIITKNELMKNKCSLQVDIKDNIRIKGEPTKLSQVLINLVINAMQAYKGDNGIISLVLKKESDNAIISVEDFAGGIDEKIEPYIFQNILTTKGTGGTGLGLYLAHSVIKGDFSGEISFETEISKGTKFIIKIPILK